MMNSSACRRPVVGGEGGSQEIVAQEMVQDIALGVGDLAAGGERGQGRGQGVAAVDGGDDLFGKGLQHPACAAPRSKPFSLT